MEQKKKYNQILILGIFSFIVGCSSPVSWNSPEVITTFMKNCNPINDPAMKNICQCVIDRFKVLHPDASKADAIPQADIELATKSCLEKPQ